MTRLAHKILIISLFLLLAPQAALASGYTKETITEKYFSLSLFTPSMIFYAPPGGDNSQEVQFHSAASKRFKKILELLRDPVGKMVENIFIKKKGGAVLIPFDPKLPLVDEYLREESLKQGTTKCCLDFSIRIPDLSALRVCFDRVPEIQEMKELKKKVLEYKDLPSLSDSLMWGGPG